MIKTVTASTSTIPRKLSPPSTLFSLPLKIRLQIYKYLIISHPSKHTYFFPSTTYPPHTSPAYFPRAINSFAPPCFQIEFKSDPSPFPSASPSEPTEFPTPALRGSGCGYVPSTLLRTCKQVYEEGKMLAWEQNEYAFTNWICSGVFAARAFLRSLKSWQRKAMRWAMIGVLGRDLEDTWVATTVGGPVHSGEWKDLCSLWSGDRETGEGGLWGLRLSIKGCVGDVVVGEDIGSSGGDTYAATHFVVDSATADVMPELPAKSRAILDVSAQWVTAGLSEMTSLRWLELEIEDEEVSKDAKVRFCIELGKKLSVMAGRKIGVMFVEKVVEIVEKIDKGGVGWGEPGDDSIWASDTED